MIKERILNIPLNNDNFLEVKEKMADGYRWRELTFKSGEGEIYIGSYNIYDFSRSREWLKYNSKYIVILTSYNVGYDYTDISVKVFFDIENKQFIEGPDNELMDMYVERFKGRSRKKIK